MAITVLAAGTGETMAAGDVGAGSQSGLPVPRFVSLKSDRVYVRGGPAKDHEVTWVYTRSGLPVEITAEYENWRRIRDWEGAEGWVYHSLLSGRRTALIAGKSKAPAKDPLKEPAKAAADLIPLHESADAGSRVTARLEAGVLGNVKRCGGHWCRIVGEGYDGWIEQERLWGVYPNEKVD